MRALLIALGCIACIQVAVADTAISPRMHEAANRLIQLGLQDELGYQIVESLTTEVGPRLAGTEAEARARDWAVAKLQQLGFSNIRVGTFPVPLWLRGVEQAQILSPFPQPLVITALGGSTATGPEGVAGEVVVFDSLAALQAAPDRSLQGKIAFIDETMTRTQDGSSYTVAVAKRRQAAYEAYRARAHAVLIRSVGTSGHRFAHTGQMRRVLNEGPPGAPAAALAAPDADQLRRALDRGVPVRVKLVLTPQILPPAQSGNVLAEIPGRESPGEIVLVGAHLDSWDLGTGAIDDGAGVGIVVAAARLLMTALEQAPKRTVRVVLFGSEEVGLVGAQAYAEQHAGELADHIIATESDFGAGSIWRFDTRVADSKLPLMAEISRVLHSLGIGPGTNTASGGPDMRFIRQAGVPVVTLKQNGWDYFDVHHTPDDTLDKIDPATLAQNVAAYAAFIYLAAESDAYFR